MISQYIVPILGTLVALLAGIVTFFIREWRRDRQHITRLSEEMKAMKVEIAAFHNGSSAAVIVDRVRTLWEIIITRASGKAEVVKK